MKSGAIMSYVFRAIVEIPTLSPKVSWYAYELEPIVKAVQDSLAASIKVAVDEGPGDVRQHHAYLSTLSLDGHWHQLQNQDIDYRLAQLRRGANVGPFLLSLTEHTSNLISGMFSVNADLYLATIKDYYNDSSDTYDESYLLDFPNAPSDTLFYGIRTFFGLQYRPYIWHLLKKRDIRGRRPFIALADKPSEVGFGVPCALKCVTTNRGRNQPRPGRSYLIPVVHKNSSRSWRLVDIGGRRIDPMRAPRQLPP